MNSALQVIGLCKKAGKLKIGEKPIEDAVASGQIVLIAVAADAAENSLNRANKFAEKCKANFLKTDFSKEDIGNALGRSSCAMFAITDKGLSEMFIKKIQKNGQ